VKSQTNQGISSYFPQTPVFIQHNAYDSNTGIFLHNVTMCCPPDIIGLVLTLLTPKEHTNIKSRYEDGHFDTRNKTTWWHLFPCGDWSLIHLSFLSRHTYAIHRQTSCWCNKDICKHA